MSEPATTDDTILGGRVRLRQPAKGYRVAIDPVLLAAVLTDGFRGRILDLGCGVGAAALCAATRLPDATAVGVERDPWLAELARQNVAANALTDRVAIVTADIRAYVPSEPFDAVLMNPPYLEPTRANAQSDPRKAAATIEDDVVSLDVWIDVALAHLAPDGAFIMIHRADRLDDVRAALQGRVREVTAFPLWPKAGAAPKRVIVCAGPRGALPRPAHGLVLHEIDGRYTDAAERVLRHAGGLTT